MNKYKVITGTHYDISNKPYPRGSVIETEDELDVMFPNKFEKLASVEKEAVEPAVTSPESDTAGKGTKSSTKPTQDADSPVAEDVTDLFPKAVDADITVSKKDGVYTLTDTTDGSLIETEKTLTTKKAVTAVIKSYL